MLLPTNVTPFISAIPLLIGETNINLKINDIVESAGAQLTVPAKTISLTQSSESTLTSPAT